MAKRIGELLVEGGLLTQSQLEQALFAQRKDGRKLGQVLIELGLVSEVQLTQTLSRQLSVPWVSLYHVDFSRSLLNLVPREIADKYCLVPIFVRRVRKQGETLYVAMDDPTNEGAIEDVRRAAALAVKPMIACPSDIRAAIRVYYFGEAAPAPPPPSSAAQVPPAAPASTTQVGKAAAPAAPRPPLPERARSRPDIVLPPDGAATAPPSSAAPAAPPPRAPAPSIPEDGPDTAPEIHAEEKEIVAPRRSRPKMISLTLLDGTTISLPASANKQPSRPDAEPASSEPGQVNDQLTARDLVSALRAVSHGADASEILGTEPRWEALFATLLSIMLRKGLIADWEFLEEFRRI